MALTLRKRLLFMLIFIGTITCTYYLYTYIYYINNWLSKNLYQEGMPLKMFTLDSGWDERAFFLVQQRLKVLNAHKEVRLITYPIGGLTARVVAVGQKNQFWDLVEHGRWERNTYMTFMQFISSDTVVIDVGTWIGPTILFSAQLAHRTYAIEADPAAFIEASFNLKQNVKEPWYTRIHLQAGCLGTQEALVEMRTAEPGNSMSSIHKFYMETNKSVATKWTVRCYTLPYILRTWRIDPTNEHVFIKIDIESYECKILPSLYSWLVNMKRKPTLYIAMHSQIVPCEKEEYEAIVKIASLFRFRSSSFIVGNNTVNGMGEYLLSDMMAPVSLR